MPLNDVALTVAAVMFVVVPVSLAIVLVLARRRLGRAITGQLVLSDKAEPTRPARIEIDRINQEAARRFVEDLGRVQ